MTRGSALVPRWGLCPHTLIIGSRSALAMGSVLRSWKLKLGPVLCPCIRRKKVGAYDSLSFCKVTLGVICTKLKIKTGQIKAISTLNKTLVHACSPLYAVSKRLWQTRHLGTFTSHQNYIIKLELFAIGLLNSNCTRTTIRSGIWLDWNLNNVASSSDEAVVG